MSDEDLTVRSLVRRVIELPSRPDTSDSFVNVSTRSSSKGSGRERKKSLPVNKAGTVSSNESLTPRTLVRKNIDLLKDASDESYRQSAYSTPIPETPRARYSLLRSSNKSTQNSLNIPFETFMEEEGVKTRGSVSSVRATHSSTHKKKVDHLQELRKGIEELQKNSGGRPEEQNPRRSADTHSAKKRALSLRDFAEGMNALLTSKSQEDLEKQQRTPRIRKKLKVQLTPLEYTNYKSLLVSSLRKSPRIQDGDQSVSNENDRDTSQSNEPLKTTSSKMSVSFDDQSPHGTASPKKASMSQATPQEILQNSPHAWNQIQKKDTPSDGASNPQTDANNDTSISSQQARKRSRSTTPRFVDEESPRRSTRHFENRSILSPASNLPNERSSGSPVSLKGKPLSPSEDRRITSKKLSSPKIMVPKRNLGDEQRSVNTSKDESQSAAVNKESPWRSTRHVENSLILSPASNLPDERSSGSLVNLKDKTLSQSEDRSFTSKKLPSPKIMLSKGNLGDEQRSVNTSKDNSQSSAVNEKSPRRSLRDVELYSVLFPASDLPDNHSPSSSVSVRDKMSSLSKKTPLSVEKRVSSTALSSPRTRISVRNLGDKQRSLNVSEDNLQASVSRSAKKRVTFMAMPTTSRKQSHSENYKPSPHPLASSNKLKRKLSSFLDETTDQAEPSGSGLGAKYELPKSTTKDIQRKLAYDRSIDDDLAPPTPHSDVEEDESENDESDVESSDDIGIDVHNSEYEDVSEEEVIPTQIRAKKKKDPDPNKFMRNYMSKLFRFRAKYPVHKECVSTIFTGFQRLLKEAFSEAQAYAEFAGRKSLQPEDITLLMKKYGFINEMRPREFLIMKYMSPSCQLAMIKHA